MRACTWLPLLLLLSGCKPQRDTAKKQVQLTTSPPSLLTDVSSAAPATQDLLVDVAKSVMGLNPASDDRHDHIGLVNVAGLFGYDLPLNDCGSPWRTAATGSGGSFVIAVSSDHSKGTGTTCTEADPHAPVAYLFKDWSAQVDSAAWEAFTSAGVKESGPKAQGVATGSAAITAVVTASLDANGSRLWTSSETVEAATAAASSPQTLPLNYSRSVAKQAAILPTLAQPPSYGLSAMVSGTPSEAAPGALTVKAGAFSDPATPTTKISCDTTVAVPPGCGYRAVLTARFQQRVRRIKASLQLIPRQVGLQGRLGSQAPCHQRLLAQPDGSCGGAMGADHQGFAAWFGHTDPGFNFAQDLAAQASARSDDSAGDWDFAAMRLLPGQQNQGIPTIDWALHYFELGVYAKQLVRFDQIEEAVVGCDLHVEVSNGSGPNCTPPADQVIAPSGA